MNMFGNGLAAGDGTMGFTFFGPTFDDLPANTNVSTQSQTTTRDPHWLSVFNTSASVLSQFLASRGRYPTTQVGGSGVTALVSASPYGPAYSQYQQPLTSAQANPRGVGLDDAATSVTDFVARNPLLVGGVALGAFLLFREPPRRR